MSPTTAIEAPLRRLSTTASTGAAIGLDIGSQSAKLVLRRKRGREQQIENAHCLPLPGIATTNANALAQLLCHWLDEHSGGRRRELVISLPSVLVDYETIELPAETASFTTKAMFSVHAQENMRRILGDDVSRASYDYWVTAASGPQSPQKMHLAWAPSDFAAELVARLAKDGWYCRTIDAAGPALARAAAAGLSEPRRQLAVNLGTSDVTFVCCRDGLAHHVRNGIKLSPPSAAKMVAEKFAIRDAAAEELLASIGIAGGSSQPHAQLAALLSSRLNDWLMSLSFEIERTLRYWRHVDPKMVAEEIVLCGGGACVRGLAGWLTERLRLEVRLAQVPRGWRWTSAQPFSPRFALAAALAHREGSS